MTLLFLAMIAALLLGHPWVALVILLILVFGR